MNKKQKEYKYKSSNNSVRVIFIVGIILIFTSPFITIFLCDILGLKANGELGETIGGMTSPVVSLLGSILVYFSFMEQTKANSIQYDELLTDRKTQEKKEDYEEITNEYRELKENIYNIPFTKTLESSGFTKEVIRGIEALEYFTYVIEKSEGNFIEETKITRFVLNSVLVDFKQLHISILDSALERRKKKHLFNKLFSLYYTTIMPYTPRILACCEKTPEMKAMGKSIAELEDLIKVEMNKMAKM